MLEQLHAGLAEKVVAVDQFLADVAPQVIAFGLDDFDRAELFFFFSGHGRASARA